MLGYAHLLGLLEILKHGQEAFGRRRHGRDLLERVRGVCMLSI